MSKSNPVNGILSNVGDAVKSILASNIPSPTPTHSISPCTSPGNLPSIVSSPSTSPYISFSNSPITPSNPINIISKLFSFLSSVSPSNIINGIASKIPDIPSIIPELSKIPDLPLNNLTDIIPFNSTNIISTNLPNIPVKNITDTILSNIPDIPVKNITDTVLNNVPNLPSIAPIDITINVPDVNIHEPEWIGNNFFKLWVILFTTGICCLGLFGIGLGFFSLCCTYYKDSKHDYQQHPPYSISVVNSPPPENDKVKEIRDILTENSLDNRELTGNPSHYNANPYDEEGL